MGSLFSLDYIISEDLLSTCCVPGTGLSPLRVKPHDVFSVHQVSALGAVRETEAWRSWELGQHHMPLKWGARVELWPPVNRSALLCSIQGHTGAGYFPGLNI